MNRFTNMTGAVWLLAIWQRAITWLETSKTAFAEKAGILWERIVTVGKPFWFAEDEITVEWFFPLSKVLKPRSVKAKYLARSLLALLLTGLLLVSTLNVTLNIQQGEIMNRLQEFLKATDATGREAAKQAFYASLFGVAQIFIYGTFIVVLYRWIRAKLGLVWRQWLTNHFLGKYFHHRNYYQLSWHVGIDNPDERLAQDTDAWVHQSLSIALTALDSIIVLVMFGTLLISISAWLTLIVVVYSIAGTGLILLFGRKLVSLNFNQLKLEADFRFGLVHVRNNVESIALYQGEKRELAMVNSRFDAAVYNFNLLIGWTRNVGFFQTAFDYFVIIIPYLVIAPLFFLGKTELGTFQQASMAFGQILSALAVVVTEFRSITQYVANSSRLSAFTEAMDELEVSSSDPQRQKIETVIAPRLSLKSVTLLTPQKQRVLVENLTAEIPAGSGLLVVGPSGVGKSSLLRGFAGLFDSGSGTITRPALEQLMFIPQAPYMPLGSLKDQLTYPDIAQPDTESRLQEVLERVNLGNLIERSGGLDKVELWSSVLSPGERQRVAIARFILSGRKHLFLDEATSALDVPTEERLYAMIRESGITYVSVGHRPSLIKYHDQVLELLGDGKWKMVSPADYKPGS